MLGSHTRAESRQHDPTGYPECGSGLRRENRESLIDGPRTSRRSPGRRWDQAKRSLKTVASRVVTQSLSACGRSVDGQSTADLDHRNENTAPAARAKGLRYSVRSDAVAPRLRIRPASCVLHGRIGAAWPLSGSITNRV